MPRQTNNKTYQLPDGFKMEISADGITYVDVGILVGGTVITFNWTDFEYDAGNYEELIDQAVDPRVALAPTPVIHWDPTVIESLFGGFMEEDLSSGGSSGDGENVNYAGTSKRVTLTRQTIRLSHYDVDVDDTPTDADIDWQFILYNAKVDSGGSWAFGGVVDDALDSITVSFTGRPDPANLFRLFNFFKRIAS